jgi:hypothetical protein
MVNRGNRFSRQGGFTLAELAIALFVMVEVIIAVLLLFDFSNKLSRVQTQVTDLQQSVRVGQYTMVRTLRMAGRGGLPIDGTFAANVYDGAAVGIRNNVPVDEGINPAAAATDPPNFANPRVLAGTDVVTFRAVISTPLFQLNPANTAEFALVDSDADNIPNTGVLKIHDHSPTGVPQDLQPWIDAVDEDRHEAMLIGSPVDDGIYAVVELDPTGAGTDVSDPTLISLEFVVQGGTHSAAYLALSPGGTWPQAFNSASQVGILEEYRYYIREDHAVQGDLTSDLVPRLSRARFLPGTNVVYGADNDNLHADIADSMVDLQTAIAFDANGDGIITDTKDETDEWVFNSADDDPTTAPWNWAAPAAPTVYYVRLSLLGRTERRDPKYAGNALQEIEDHAYNEPLVPANETQRIDRMFRRRFVQTVVDLRNL